MTPVRNEAWILDLFLTTTSIWADYIIIADQMSTDGSREIASKYPKVILIDNRDPLFNEDERQSMLISKAREVAVGRDCLMWGLDADEILAANYLNTDDWQEILSSKPGAVFWFKWAEIAPDCTSCHISHFFPWLFHDDGKEPHSNYVRKMHPMRIPYPIDEKDMHYVNDFPVLHFGPTNINRVHSKQYFYQYVDWEVNGRDPVSLSMQYKKLYDYSDFNSHLLPQWCYNEVNGYDFDMFQIVDLNCSISWMEQYVKERVLDCLKNGKRINRIDIWDNGFRQRNNLKDPRNLIDKLAHKYFSIASKNSHNLIFRFINKILSKVY